MTLGSTQSNPKRGKVGLGESDRSVTPSGSSPLTTSSTGCNVWIAPTDRGTIVEESGEEDKDEDRGDEGEGGAEEEDVGRDKEDMTNF